MPCFAVSAKLATPTGRHTLGNRNQGGACTGQCVASGTTQKMLCPPAGEKLCGKLNAKWYPEMVIVQHYPEIIKPGGDPLGSIRRSLKPTGKRHHCFLVGIQPRQISHRGLNAAHATLAH
eukprot:1140568-Pelagomonas_calceolata.AAC.1